MLSAFKKKSRANNMYLCTEFLILEVIRRDETIFCFVVLLNNYFCILSELSELLKYSIADIKTILFTNSRIG